MRTYIRTSGKMPDCGRCKNPMPYWDFREDESTYRCDDCHDIERTEFWSKTIKELFKGTSLDPERKI